jgi:hypothetical protein
LSLRDTDEIRATLQSPDRIAADRFATAFARDLPYAATQPGHFRLLDKRS